MNIYKNKTISIWGLSFKPNTDDLRESISCDLIEALLEAGAIIQAYDPVAGHNAKLKFESFSRFNLCKSKIDALHQSELLAVMTAWPEFHYLDMELITQTMKQAVLFDGRNMYDQETLTASGISYFAIGKGFFPAALNP